MRRDESIPRDNLVTAYTEAAGPKPGAALAALNAALGTRYSLARLGQWRRGERQIPDRVQAVMRRAVLELELGPERAAELEPLLTPARTAPGSRAQYGSSSS